jgi:hypothetical protein
VLVVDVETYPVAQEHAAGCALPPVQMLPAPQLVVTQVVPADAAEHELDVVAVDAYPTEQVHGAAWAPPPPQLLPAPQATQLPLLPEQLAVVNDVDA